MATDTTTKPDPAPRVHEAPRPRPTLGRRVWQRLRRHEDGYLPFVGLIVLFAGWELFPALGLVDPYSTSSPSRIVASGFEYVTSESFLLDVRVTGKEFLLGYALSVVVGVPLGLAMGMYRPLRRAMDPIVSFFYSMPHAALMPLFIIWFGLGAGPIVAFIFSMCVFPMLIATVSGVQSADAVLTRVGRSFGANDLQLFRTVIVPATFPSIIAGLRLAVGKAFIGVVVGEFISSTAGLGHMILISGSLFQTDRVFVGLVLVATAGVAASELLGVLERKVEKWRPSL